MIRYRFSEFALSPRRRLLLRDGREVPLIPRYFDLLVLLIERRQAAVHRRDIFDCVWTDVIVSDSALSQAVRTLRRTLGDDSREPRFIRTVARHGYRFVFAEVIEEEDDGAWPEPVTGSQPQAVEVPAGDAFEPLLDRLTRVSGTEDDRREAAELLHALGTSEALSRLGTRPGHASARALLRDVRWDAPGAGEVPVLGAPAPLAVARELLRLRLRRAARIAASRWAGAAAGSGLAGVAAGAAGGLLLAAAPGSAAPVALAPVLAVIGGACGALGGAGVGAGLSLAEASARSHRALALISAAALGGGVVGGAVQWLARWGLAALVGLDLDVGGGLEGVVIGGAAGAGYAIATRTTEGGMAAPRGSRRLRSGTHHRGHLRTGRACAHAGRTSPRRRDHPRHRRRGGRVSRDAGAPRQADRRAGFRSGLAGDPGVRRRRSVRPWSCLRADAPSVGPAGAWRPGPTHSPRVRPLLPHLTDISRNPHRRVKTPAACSGHPLSRRRSRSTGGREEDHPMETLVPAAICHHGRIRVATERAVEFIDLTKQIEALAAEAGIRAGLVNIQSLHTTTAIVINQAEPLLLVDFDDPARPGGVEGRALSPQRHERPDPGPG